MMQELRLTANRILRNDQEIYIHSHIGIQPLFDNFILLISFTDPCGSMELLMHLSVFPHFLLNISNSVLLYLKKTLPYGGIAEVSESHIMYV